MRIIKPISAVIFAALCIAVVSTVATMAQNTAKSAEKKEDVFIDGDVWRMKSSKDANVYTITGNVVIKHLDTTVTADKVEYTESTDKEKKTKIAVAEGNIHIVDGQNDITGKKATADLNARDVVVETDVKLIVHPKKSDTVANPDSTKAKLQQETTINCDKLDYLYKKKIATATGNLKITQKSRLLICKTAVYDLKQELVTLTGDVTVTDENGQKFTSTGIVKASFKEGEEWIEAENGSAVVKIDSEELNPEETKTPVETPEKK